MRLPHEIALLDSLTHMMHRGTSKHAPGRSGKVSFVRPCLLRGAPGPTEGHTGICKTEQDRALPSITIRPAAECARLMLTSSCLGGARFYTEIARRSRAVRDLPGPKYGLFGIVSAVRRGDIHRRAASAVHQCRMCTCPCIYWLAGRTQAGSVGQ